MKLKNTLWTSIALAMVLTLPTMAKNEKKEDVVKIVYQCDFPDAKRIHLMLNTLNNVVKYYQKSLQDYELDVVALGPCLQYVMKDFKDTKFVKKPYITKGGPVGNGTMGRFKSLVLTAGDNLKIFACQNTMKKKHVDAKQIADYVQLTPSGIIKIVDLERDGFAYIKIK